MSTKFKISLDATEYRNELNKVVSETEAARSQLGCKSSVSAPVAAGNTGTVSVTAEVTGMEKVQELYDKISALPEKKNVVVAVNDQASAPIKNVQNEIKKIPNKKGVTITVPNTDNELNRTKDPVARIANRQRLIAGEQNRNDDLHKKTEAAKAQMAQYAPGAKGADAQKYEDAKKAYLQNAAIVNELGREFLLKNSVPAISLFHKADLWHFCQNM